MLVRCVFALAGLPALRRFDVLTAVDNAMGSRDCYKWSHRDRNSCDFCLDPLATYDEETNQSCY